MRRRLLLPFLALFLLLPALLACAGNQVQEPLPTMNPNLPDPTAPPAPAWAANAVKPAEPTATPDPEPQAAANRLPEPLADQTPIPEVVINNDPLVLDQRPKEPALTAVPQSRPKDICYRSPHIQKEILGRLNLSSCQVVNERELFRIQGNLDAKTTQPGDLAGLANISAVKLEAKCGSWTDPNYVAAQLAGLNRQARLEIRRSIPITYSGELPQYIHRQLPADPEQRAAALKSHQSAAANEFLYAVDRMIQPTNPGAVHPTYDIPDLGTLVQNYHNNGDGYSLPALENWQRQAQTIKTRLATEAAALAAALQANGFAPAAELQTPRPGYAYLGQEHDPAVRIELRLELNPEQNSCPEPNAAMTLPGEK